MKAKKVLSLLLTLTLLVSFALVLPTTTADAVQGSSDSIYYLDEQFELLTNAQTDDYLAAKGYTVYPGWTNGSVGFFGCGNGGNTYNNAACITWEANQWSLSQNPPPAEVYLEVPVVGGSGFDCFVANMFEEDFYFKWVDSTGNAYSLDMYKYVITESNMDEFNLRTIITEGGGLETQYVNSIFVNNTIPGAAVAVRICFPTEAIANTSWDQWKAQLVSFRVWREINLLFPRHGELADTLDPEFSWSPNYSLREKFKLLTNAQTDDYLAAKGYTVYPAWTDGNVGVFGGGNGGNSYKNAICATWEVNQWAKTQNPPPAEYYLEVPVNGGYRFDAFAVNWFENDDFRFQSVNSLNQVTNLTPVLTQINDWNKDKFDLSDIIQQNGELKRSEGAKNQYYYIDQLPMDAVKVRILFPTSVIANPQDAQWKAQLVQFRSWPVNSGDYNFYIDEYVDGDYEEIYSEENITTNSFSLSMSLDPDTNYRWRVTENITYKGETVESAKLAGGNTFTSYIDPATHPANSGKNFSFNSTISESVLKNYLARSITFSFLDYSNPQLNAADDERLIINIGAKYIGRAACPWIASALEEECFPAYQERIERLHQIDPDIVFESCVFEVVYGEVNNIPIPPWVFQAFNQPVVTRNFNKNSMVFPQDLGGLGAYTVPDITKLETKMWFYYRACRFIDLGFEGIHMGQIHLIGSADSGFANSFEVFNKIRAYAANNARRGMVLLNAHTHGIRDNIITKRLLFDFHSYPMRPQSNQYDQPHIATEANPQTTTLKKNVVDAIYGKSMGGKAPSGWNCTSLPYFVEVDNCGGAPAGTSILCRPTDQWCPWGFDEISWFANQPQWYRHDWIDYAYNWVRTNDSAGAFEPAGNRGALIVVNDDMQNIQTEWKWYQINSRIFNPDRPGLVGNGDEEAIRSTWIDHKNFLS